MSKKALGVLSFVLVAAVAQAQARQSPPAPRKPPRPAPVQAPEPQVLADLSDLDLDLPDLADVVGLRDLDVRLDGLRAAADLDLGPTVEKAKALALASLAESGTWFGQEVPAGERSESSLYASGTRYLDAGRYEQAATMFDRAALKNGKKTDGALYWKAYALSRVGRNKDALAALDDLLKRFPSSRWANDARALQVEVRQSSGRPVNPSQQGDEELKLIALNGLIARDPERGIPMVEQILAGSASPRMKERALFVLAQSGSPRAKAVVVDVAKGKGNPDLQLKALEYIGVLGDGPDVPLLVGIYRSSSDVEVKKRIIRSLARTGRHIRVGVDIDSSIQEAVQESLESLEHLDIGGMLDEEEIARITIDAERMAADARATAAVVLKDQQAKLEELKARESALKDRQLTREDELRVQEQFERARAEAERALREARTDVGERRRIGRVSTDKASQARMKEASEALWSLYQEETSPELKREILRNMHFGDQSDRVVQIAKTEKDAQLRQAAVRSLMFDRTPKTAETLVALYQAEKDQAMKRQIINVLATQDSAGPLVQLARQETDPQLRKRIVERLSLMKDKEATDYMLEILRK